MLIPSVGLIAIGASTLIAAQATSSTTSIGLSRPDVSEATLGERIEARGFPAMSADGRKIIVVDRKHPMEAAASVLVFDVQTKAQQREFPLLSDEDGAIAPATSLTNAVLERVAEVERMIESGSFRAMVPLYSLPVTGHSPVEVFTGASRSIRFDRRSGVLVVMAPSGMAESLRLQPPKIVPTTQDLHPHNACISHPEPSAAWISADGRIAVIRVEYRSGRDGCESPELWLVEDMR